MYGRAFQKVSVCGNRTKIFLKSGTKEREKVLFFHCPIRSLLSNGILGEKKRVVGFYIREYA